MFQRPAASYRIDFDRVDAAQVMGDEAQPLANIVNLVPDGSKVLDVGAGNGFLGWLFRKVKPGVVVDGIEPSDAGSEVARGHYRTFRTAFVQDVKAEILKESYDYIVLADVVEHVQDPLGFLRDLTDGLSDRTKVVLSIPNVAHYSVRLAILNGGFRYVDSGLLERTHIRFFTLATIEEMVKALGWSVEALHHLKRYVASDVERPTYGPGAWGLARMLRDRSALTYQYLLVLTRRSCDRVETERGRLPWRHAVRAFLMEWCRPLWRGLSALRRAGR